MIEVLKNISHKTKTHHSIISRENCEFFPIFIEIIAYVRGKKQTKIACLKIIDQQKSSYLQNYSRKIVNFADFKQNKNVFTKKKKKSEI